MAVNMFSLTVKGELELHFSVLRRHHVFVIVLISEYKVHEPIYSAQLMAG